MSLPTAAQITTMDFVSRGTPYVYVAAKTGIVTETMDYVSRGAPFVTNGFGGVVASAIKTFNGLAYASAKMVKGVAIAAVKTWNGLA